MPEPAAAPEVYCVARNGARTRWHGGVQVGGGRVRTKCGLHMPILFPGPQSLDVVVRNDPSELCDRCYPSTGTA